MTKIMTLELLSNIKGAEPSAAVSELFTIIKEASSLTVDIQGMSADSAGDCVSFDSLRDDVVMESQPSEREIIRENFPAISGGFLVVSKVIEEL